MSLYIGLMSGTSMDGIDAALVDCDGTVPRLVDYHEAPFPEAVKAALSIATQPDPYVGVREFMQLHVRVGRCFADAAIALLDHARAAVDDVAAIGSHGQTLLHRPQDDPPFTLQIGDPATIAVRTGIATVADFRSLDVAAGGQGAPLLPAFHETVFRTTKQNRIVVNIGGIANVTLLPAKAGRPVNGYDTGPGNCLMDQWIDQHCAQPYDHDAAWAAQGDVDTELLSLLLNDDYFTRVPPKSTGRDYFNLSWLQTYLKRLRRMPSAEDIQRSLLEFTAQTIAAAIQQSRLDDPLVIACGGGAQNRLLLRRLQALLVPARLDTSRSFGLAGPAVEATAFAWFAKQRLAGVKIRLTTGAAAHEHLLGVIYAPP